MEWTSISERLVDYFLIIGPGRGVVFDKPKGRKTSFGNRLNSWYKVSHPVPTILRRFPETDHKDSELPFDVTYFCQPNGCCADVREPRSHIFMLTDTETNIHTYGVCLSLPHLFGSLTSAQEAEVLNSDSICIQEWGVLSICILSRHPFFDFFEKSLNTVFHFVEHFCGKDFNWNTLIQARYQPSGLHGNTGNMVQEIEEWINGLISLKAPIPCESALEVELEVDPATVVCYPPSSRLPLLELPVHKIFQRLGVCNVLEIFKLVLSEQKVILHSEDPAFVTECVLTIVGLLYPLQYLFPIIPLLPTSMPTAENLLMVPTPFIIGVCSSFLTKMQDIHHAESWVICLDTLQFQSPSRLDAPVLEFPLCILQLQADIRKALDKVEKINRGESTATEPSICGSEFSTESQLLTYMGDEVDVMIRIAFIEFLFSPEILGCVDQFLCIFRLFPRPVVALRYSTFMTTYQKHSPATGTSFIKDLVRSQGIEYFLEWSLYPTNFAYDEIRKGINEVDRVSDKKQYYLHKSGTKIIQVCLYTAEDSSLLYQEMLSYKAGQASLNIISPREIHSDDSDWEYVGGDMCDWSGFSTPSYCSGDGIHSAANVQELLIASQTQSDPHIQTSFASSGGQEESDIEVDFHTPRRFKFPDTGATPVVVSELDTTGTTHSESSPDASSLTESGHYGDQSTRHSRYASGNLMLSRSISCEALPFADRLHHSGVDEPDSFATPGSIKGLSKFSTYYRAPTPPIIPLVSPTEPHYTEDKVLVTRRTISGNPELKKSWLNLSPAPPSTEVVEFSNPPSGLQRSLSLRVKKGAVMPSISRTVPVAAVSHSHNQESQIHDLVGKLLSGQGLPWLKSAGLKHLASHEKTRVMLLRLLEMKLGVRTPNMFVMSTELYVLPKGVSKPVFKGLSDLLKYLLQCIEEEFQKEPEATIFSAFLILRLAFCIYLQPKDQQSLIKQDSEYSSPFSFLFSSRGSETPTHISSRGSTNSASSSSRSSPDGTPAHSTLGTPVLKTSNLARHVSTSASTPSDSSTAMPVRSRRSGYVNVHSSSPMIPNGRISEELDQSDDLVDRGVDLTPLRVDKDEDGITSTATPSNISTPVHSVGEGSGSGRAESEVQLSPPHPDVGTNSPVEAAQLTHETHNGITRDLTPSPNNASNISTADTPSPQPIANHRPETPPQQFSHRSESPMSSSKKQNRGWNCPQSPTLFPPLPEGLDLRGCTFLYKDLMKTLGNTRTFLLNRQFWNVLFMSTVDMDRNYLGWNERTAELYERYSSLSEAHRQAFGSAEDTLLSLVLHNLLVYMLMVGLSPEETTDLIHRLTARTRLATAEERLLQQTLKHVEQNTSTEVDLSDLGLLALYSEIHPTISYIVHYGVNMIAPVYKLQITDEVLILRRFPDEKISSRLWNDSISEVSCNERRATISIKYRDTHGEYSHHFHSKQFVKVYNSLQTLLPRSS